MSEHIKQNAGDISAQCFTGGSPQWVKFTVEKHNGDMAEFSLHPNAVHDLRHVVDRMIARVPECGE